MIIAVDGPAASGKGTLGRRLAERYDLAYLDTGLLYRAVGLAVLDAAGDPSDVDVAAAATRALDPSRLSDPALRSQAAGSAASQVAAHEGVRAALLDFQRDFAQHPPGGAAGAVLDGRDIGTVVCPDADVKLFVTASAEERARRRRLESLAKGESVEFAAVLDDIRARDARDSARVAAPMKPAKDAVLLDTTELDIDAAFARAVEIVEASRAKRT